MKRQTKPHLALLVGERMRLRGEPGVPPVLRNLLEAAVEAARRQDPYQL